DSKRAVKDLADAVGARPFGQAMFERRLHHPLSLIDWQIIDVLIERPRMPFKELCGSTGLSPKTVRKHLEMLMQDEIVYITPKLGALADSGELVYNLAVFGRIGMSELRRIIGE